MHLMCFHSLVEWPSGSHRFPLYTLPVYFSEKPLPARNAFSTLPHTLNSFGPKSYWPGEVYEAHEIETFPRAAWLFDALNPT